MKKSFVVSLGVCSLALCTPHIFLGQDAAPATPAQPTPAQAAEPLVKPSRPLDVDAMAARMTSLQPEYKRLRDAALKVYAKRPPNKFDAINAQQVRMAVYLTLWGDFYREGLYRTYLDNERKTGDDDPMVQSIESIAKNLTFHGTSDSFTEELRPFIEAVENSEYPDEFKYQAWIHFGNVIAKAATVPRDKANMPKSFAMLPDMMKKAAGDFRKVIKQKASTDLLITLAEKGFYDMEDDDAGLKTLGDEIDRAFAEEDPENPVRATINGLFYISYAWCARGSGFSDTVTEAGSKAMDERIAKAQTILEAAYKAHPEIKQTCRGMISVELAQGKGKDRMELWFQRAIKADPNYYMAYDSKANYLRERWYGSHEELWAFGIECLKAGNWQAKEAAIINIEASDLAEDGENSVFETPKIWGPLEEFFRGWLQRYPESRIFRSRFVKYAALGKHWDIVKEQTKILGNDWDRETFSGMNYNAIKKQAQTETGQPAPTPATGGTSAPM